MKKIMLFAAACVALVACNKNIDTTAPKTEEAMAFEKGQSVTLAVNTEEPTRVTSSLDATTGAVNFAWEAGDKIKVTVGTESAEFTLSKGEGTATAEFTGIMPAAGNTFDVQYPVEDPDLSSQTYVENALPKDMMKMTATGCTIADGFTIIPQYSVLRLNLWGDKTVGKIVVTNTSSTDSYTLNITDGKALGTTSDAATSFFIVVPNGECAFSAEIFDKNSNHIDKVLAKQTFKSGNIINMPALKVLENALPGFFSVSATKKVRFSKGCLYYNHSKTSFAFEDNQYSFASSYNTNHISHFRWANNSGTLSSDISSAISTSTSISGSTSDIFFTNATATTPRTDFTVAGQKGIWRTLSGGTSGEYKYLLTVRTVNGGTGVGKSFQPVNITGVSGYSKLYGLLIYPDGYTAQVTASTPPTYSTSQLSELEAAGCVFLPSTGYRNGQSVTTGNNYFWTSTPYSAQNAYVLKIQASPEMNNTYRKRGHTVRLVCEIQ